jgi:hypothetical protein
MYRTYNNNVFNPNKVEELKVDIVDIAHALSHVCRYNGHLIHHYSVAQHSVLVSGMVPEYLRLEALLHDAAEAYIPDMPTDLKRHFPAYIELEELLLDHIYKQLGVKRTNDPAIKEADLKIREIEMYSLSYWLPDDTSVPFLIDPMKPIIAKNAFLNMFLMLTDRPALVSSQPSS